MTKNSALLKRLVADAIQAGQEYQDAKQARRDVAKFKRKIGRYKFDRYRKFAGALLQAGLVTDLPSAFSQAEALLRARAKKAGK